MLIDGGDMVLWGFLMRGIGFRCQIALLDGFGLVSLLLRLFFSYLLLMKVYPRKEFIYIC